jgi:hypothetical protein
MFGFFTGLLAFYFLRSPFPEVNLAIRTVNNSVYLNSVPGACAVGFPLATADIWDVNEEEAISRRLYTRYGLVKGYEIESIHRIHGITYAEVLYTGSGSLGSMMDVPICDFHVVNGTDVLRSWIQNYGANKYCKANQLSAPWSLGVV